ncbi:MAG: YmdB family metallophosphoesterase, partial [Phycisphaerae bacterium]|nr:YmdB family metallophosphoesterase [Phycisphaerae bacterium]
MAVNILCIGDLVGRAGRDLLAEHLPAFITGHSVDLVVCNAENVAGGSGLTPAIFEEILRRGVDVVTLGDHVYRRREIVPVLESSERIVRPANLSRQAAGKRWTVVETKSGRFRVGVACVLGQMFMKAADSPWASIDQCLGEMDDDVRIRIVDFHAEASSEKIAMGWHLDGRVTAVYGTHTHVQTADEHILPRGTAYITDLGMTGPYDSVLGRRKDHVV